MTAHTVDFKTAFEALPGNFLIIKPDAPTYTILAISDELLWRTNQERREVVGKGLFKVFPENPETVAIGPSALRDSIEKAIKYKKQDQMPTVRYDVANASGDFKELYWSASNKPVLDSNGEIAYLIHTTIDVTDQELAKQKGDANERKVHSLIESAPFPIAVFEGKEMRILLANQAIIEAWGKGNDVIGSLLRDVLPEWGTKIYQQLDDVYTTGVPYHAMNEFMEILVDGKPQQFYYNYSFTPLFEGNGRVYGVMKTAVDVTALMLAKQKLEESEMRFRHLIEQAPVAIGLTRGKELYIENMNAPMLRIIGSSRAEAVGKNLSEAMPEIQHNFILNILNNVLETAKAYRGNELPFIFKLEDKLEQHYLNVSYTPLLEKGQVTGIIHVAVDVTEQVENRKKIEESEKALKNLANAMPHVVWIAEASGEVSFYNDRVSSLEGAHKRSDGTWSWQGVLFPEDEQPTIDAWKKAVAEGTIYEQEHRVRMKDGTYRWSLSRGYPQKDEKGNVVKWYGTATDIHVQKENAEALRHSEEQLRVAVEGAELGTYNYYPLEDKLIWSPKTKELMGLPPDAEVTFDTFLQANHPDDRSRSLAALQNALQPGSDGLYENEFRVIGITNGVLRWMRSKGRVIFDSDGKPLLFTGVTQDITLRKQSEKALEEKNELLVQINNDLDNFIYTASHDLKAPISNIESLLHALLRTLPRESLNSERTSRITALMQESVDRFKKTIANLTEVVKLQKENSGEAVMVDCSEVIADVRLDLEQLIQSSGAQIEVDLSECHTIRFLEKNLRSVVYNLLSNAIKYHAPDRVPRVQITCKTTSEYQVLSVKDNGLGMDPRRFDQLFTMFKRFHSHVEGTGIGLYMVKKMVENAGGRIEVESQLGEGTTFHVYFKR